MSDSPAGVWKQLDRIVRLIDAGHLEATPAQRAYICGARDAVAELAGKPDIVGTTHPAG